MTRRLHPPLDPTKPVQIDHVILVCHACGRDRTVHFDPPLIGAVQFTTWMKTKLERCPRCDCGSCEVRAHLVNAADPS